MLLQPRVLVLYVNHFESGKGNGLSEHGRLESSGGRIGIGLQSKLQIVRPFRRDDREQLVFANGNVVFLPEAEYLCLKLQGLVLIIDHDAG
jgi:hypothetical protein